jgi:hypothetical protein
MSRASLARVVHSSHLLPQALQYCCGGLPHGHALRTDGGREYSVFHPQVTLEAL